MLDCKAIYQLPQQYDAIIGGFCLPYLSRAECIDMISQAANALRPGGVLYLSMMGETEYCQSGFEGPGSREDTQLFIYYHRADYLKESLIDNGFEILDLRRHVYPVKDNPNKTDLIIIARK